MTSTILSRRTALLAAPALVTTLGISNVMAAAHSTPAIQGASGSPRMRRIMVGDIEVTTLLAGSFPRDELQGIFGMNVDRATFEAAAAENFLSPDAAQFYFTPTLVNTGSDLILFDTGLNAAALAGAMGDAGYMPEQVSIVVITHNHGDHISGLTKEDGSPAYPNARYVTGAVEFNNGSGDAFEGKVKPLAENMTMLDDGGAVVSGITAMEAFGHTPGHMTYMIESNGESLLLAADFANHYVFSLAYPDWEVRFDRDKAAAAATRKKILGMLASDRIPFIGYHMPFPAVGFVQADGPGFRYVPMSYQLG